MNNSNIDTDVPISFYERYSGFSDSQIKEILRNHKNYQEAAVTAAVKIAIERELIHSEQDLLAPEYKSKLSVGASVFPEITNEFHYKKVVASIFRVLFILSILPIIFGIMKFAEGRLNLSILGIGLGLFWLIITFTLFKTRKLTILNLQVYLLIFGSIGLGYRLFIQETFKITDLIILVIGTIVIIYFLLFLKKLILTKPDQLSDQ